MAFNYPYGDTQQLNLNWFLSQWETFRAQWATAEEGIDHALDAEIARVETAMTDLYAARDAAAASQAAAQTAAVNAASSQTIATQQASLAQSQAAMAQNQAGIATAAAEAAGNSASSASNSASNANLSKVQAENSATAAGQSATLANDKATAAGLSAAQAGESATNAAGSAEDSEAWAVGERGGSPVASGDDTYENNSKYYADQAAAVAASIPEDYTELSDDVSELKTAVDEVWDVGFLTLTGATSRVYSYTITAGKTYYFKNLSASNVGLRTCTSDGTEIESIKNGLVSGGEVTFTAQSNASYVRVYNASSNAKVSVKTIGTVIEDVYSEIKAVDDKVNTLADDVGGYINKYEILELDMTTGYYITRNGVITETAGNYIIGEADVTAGQTYLISASTNWSNALWAWFDSSDALVEVGTISEAGSTVTSVTDIQATAPANATKIVIAYITSGTACELKHYLGKQIAGKWYGKKWVCVGDSLTEANRLTSRHYFDFVADKTDISTVNMGVSGTGYAKGYDNNKAFYQRILNCPTDADVVTIFGSFNDLSSGLELGTYTDTGTSTIAGCINTTLDNLQTIIPTVVLGIVAPTPWQSTQPTPLSAGDTYVNMLQSIAQHRSIPFLDLYRESNLRPWDSDFRELCYSNDDGYGTHPDDNGHRLIAPKFEAFLDKLLLH